MYRYNSEYRSREDLLLTSVQQDSQHSYYRPNIVQQYNCFDYRNILSHNHKLLELDLSKRTQKFNIQDFCKVISLNATIEKRIWNDNDMYVIVILPVKLTKIKPNITIRFNRSFPLWDVWPFSIAKLLILMLVLLSVLGRQEPRWAVI